MSDMKSKIFLLSTTEPIPELDGDIDGWRTHQMVRKLRANGHQVFLLISAFDHFNKIVRDKALIEKYESKFGAIVVYIPSLPYFKNISVRRIINYWLQTFWLIFFFIFKSRKNDKLLVTVPAIEHLIATYFFRGRFLIDYRDLWPAIFQEHLSGLKLVVGKPYISFLYFLLNASFDRASSILTISEEFKDEIVKLNSDCSEKVVVLRHYRQPVVSLNRPKKEIEKDWKSSNIVYAGKISVRTSIVECARYIAEDPDFSGSLHICGVGDEQLLGDLKTLCSKHPNINYLGNLDQKELRLVYESASFGLLPYQNLPDLSRALPNKFIEYISNDLFVLHDNFNPVDRFCADNNLSIAAQLGNDEYKILNDKHIHRAQDLLRLDYQSAIRVIIDLFEQ